MLKEVGASGQISLGKKFSGQLFDVVIRPDGTVVMSPVKVVPATLTLFETGAPEPISNQPAEVAEPLQSTSEWALANVTHIDAYNAWASTREPYSQRVRQWREQEKPSA